mmetsp:Transcript_101027/g.324425  ORF Transcript_101027/g.324425 Transcript_101027/m.324425 type:complete len:210 (+) Transcript_101027:761-1390(+)
MVQERRTDLGLQLVHDVAPALAELVDRGHRENTDNTVDDREHAHSRNNALHGERHLLGHGDAQEDPREDPRRHLAKSLPVLPLPSPSDGSLHQTPSEPNSGRPGPRQPRRRGAGGGQESLEVRLALKLLKPLHGQVQGGAHHVLFRCDRRCPSLLRVGQQNGVSQVGEVHKDGGLATSHDQDVRHHLLDLRARLVQRHDHRDPATHPLQ